MEKAINLAEHLIKLRHDETLSIATGLSRTTKIWKNKQIRWSQLLKKLEKPFITPETVAEYTKMPKSKQDEIKDVGGFVGGELIGGRRKVGGVKSRQILSLDADFAPVTFTEDLEMLTDFAYCIYSTHKHRPESPRLRLLIPLDRPVSPEEYEAIARKLAEDIGIDYFDDTTYQPSRLMYWPSVSSDGQYVFEYGDLPFISADEVLARYPDWQDISYWPESSRTKRERKKTADKQEDPLHKKGSIGAFCRTYTIEEAIEDFLSDVYTPCAVPGRYTYAEGSTAGGLVLYDEKYAYSNHGTDPASEQLCNAFDLVRIHKFGHMDEDSEKSGKDLPSYQAMLEFIREDEETKLTIASEKQESIEDDFTTSDPDDWKAKLDYKKGSTEPSNTLMNLKLIMQNDPVCKAIAYNALADNLEIIGEVPWEHSRFWRDADDAQIEMYIARNYGEFTKNKLMTAFTKATDDRSYHPVRDYLNALPKWDGVERADTLLIDYLGAEDNSYVRAVTRKTLCAAVRRVMNPGCKFDYMLTLVGPQGIGKSTIASKLGKDWFSDSISLTETRDKTAAEKIQGNWILEIGELAGIRKMDVETLKSFISRQDDKYRAAYGRRTQDHPRQCIFIGTTNAEDGFLRDATGGRRFWPVRCPGNIDARPWDIGNDEIDQIWAEILVRVKEKEKLVLGKEEADMAAEAQNEAMESDPREGIVRDYLELRLPEGWDLMDMYERRDWIEVQADDTEDPLIDDTDEGLIERTEVCNMEIWAECFRRDPTNISKRDSYDIATIMARFPDWERQEKLRRFHPYGPQRGYKKRVTSQKNACYTSEAEKRRKH